MRHRLLGSMIGLAVLTAFLIEAHAFPERTVRLIVPVAAGGSIDVTARVLGDALSKKWKQPVIIENRAGANMIVGTEAVAKSPPDGYTLLVGGAGPMTINVATIPDLSYDPRRDFTSVAMISSVPYVLVVNEAAGMNSVADIIRIGKQDPEKLNFASGGPAAQLAGALFKKMSGIGFVEIPFRGAAPSVQSVSAGDTHLTFADTATPGLDAPGAKLLAVTTSTRVEKLPQLPTLSDAGVPGYDYSAWIALFAPKQIPAEVRKIIEQDTLAVLADPEVRKRLEALQMEVVPLGGDALGKKVDAEIDKWNILVKETGLKLR